jgi:hypothetical protein
MPFKNQDQKREYMKNYMKQKRDGNKAEKTNKENQKETKTIQIIPEVSFDVKPDMLAFHYWSQKMTYLLVDIRDIEGFDKHGNKYGCSI